MNSFYNKNQWSIIIFVWRKNTCRFIIKKRLGSLWEKKLCHQMLSTSAQQRLWLRAGKLPCGASPDIRPAVERIVGCAAQPPVGRLALCQPPCLATSLLMQTLLGLIVANVVGHFLQALIAEIESWPRPIKKMIILFLYRFNDIIKSIIVRFFLKLYEK